MCIPHIHVGHGTCAGALVYVNERRSNETPALGNRRARPMRVCGCVPSSTPCSPDGIREQVAESPGFHPGYGSCGQWTRMHGGDHWSRCRIHWTNCCIHWTNRRDHWTNRCIHWTNRCIHWTNRRNHWTNCCDHWTNCCNQWIRRRNDSIQYGNPGSQHRRSCTKRSRNRSAHRDAGPASPIRGQIHAAASGISRHVPTALIRWRFYHFGVTTCDPHCSVRAAPQLVPGRST